MSMSGSLMGYENNNDVSQSKCKKGLKALPVVKSVDASEIKSTITGNGGISVNSCGKVPSRFSVSTHKRESCTRGHVNNLWSIWYGIIAVAFQIYIAVRCTKRFIVYLSLPWPADAPPPKFELHACLVLAGTGVLLLPILLAAAFLKLGNLANDGIKLGRHLSTCSRDPPSTLFYGNHDTGIATNLWRHGGPTAAFVHLCTAMCFLLPSLLMEARLIHAGFLTRDAIWRTDLDWVVVHRDRLVMFSLMNIPENASLNVDQSGYDTSQPYFDDESNQLNVDHSNDSNESTDARYSDYTSLQSTKTINNSSSTPLSTTISKGLMKISTVNRITSPTLPNLVSLSNVATDFQTNLDDVSEFSYSSTSRSKWTSSAYATSTTSSSTPVIVPTTTVRSRMNARNAPQRNRPKPKKRVQNSKPMTLALRDQNNMTAQSLPLTLHSLDDLDHPESFNLELDETTGKDYGPITLEFLNYAMALGVYSVRYPAVFWASNKVLGTIFSIQLVANSAQSLLSYTGMSVLYKVQVVGPLKVLPLLRHGTTTTTYVSSTLTNLLGDRFFLLNPHVTLGIFALSSLLVLCSSMIMYLYAYGRFAAFLNRESGRRVILSKEQRDSEANWAYITQPAAICLFLAIIICSAPLLYDYSVVYRGSLDGAILACIIGTGLHLVLWLILWIFLSIKKKWTFKLRVTIGKATVRSARSVKLVTDIDLLQNSKDDAESSGAPLLVVGNGRTYTVIDKSPKQAIMSVIQKAAMERKAKAQGINLDSMDSESNINDDDEQIYWLRPKLRSSPVHSTDGPSGSDGDIGQSKDKGWLNKKLKQKVTFNDLPSTSGSRKGKPRRGNAEHGGGAHEDDGDYATLRELPLVTALNITDDSASEENKLLDCVNDDQVTYYASGNHDLQPSEGEPSPLLSSSALTNPLPPTMSISCQLKDGLPLPLRPPSPTSIVHQETNQCVLAHSQIQQLMTTTQASRCLRRADSGMPHEELTPRSDSSHSPPLDITTNNSNSGHCTASNNSTSSNSETSSSGVHSNVSNISSQRRANSVEDLTLTEQQPCEDPQWRSSSLQRGIQPPTSLSGGKFPAQSTVTNLSHVIVPNPSDATNYNISNAQYVNHTPLYNGSGDTNLNVMPGCPAAIICNIENPNEATVVIRRKNVRPKLQESPSLGEEPFSRSTNMRMTSFTENNSDLRGIQASSATLPHYPTQPIVTYPHCSTMPLPHASSHSVGIFGATNMSGSSGSCGSVPRQQGQEHQQTPPVHTTVPSHTTLPSHHNGVRLSSLHSIPNPFVKRFPPVQMVGGHLAPQPWTSVLPNTVSGAHHTFPRVPSMNGKPTPPRQGQQSRGHTRRSIDRDSANFSMASSGDSDTCLPH